MSTYARPVAERCTSRFLWWYSPYLINDCEANDRVVQPPAGYLLPYWMGRYYGFINEND